LIIHLYTLDQTQYVVQIEHLLSSQLAGFILGNQSAFRQHEALPYRQLAKEPTGCKRAAQQILHMQ
jgi:hypothetical protein